MTQRIDLKSDYGEYRDAVDQRLMDFIIQSGYQPYPVPNTFLHKNSETQNRENNVDQLKNWVEGIHPSALILSGGNDIGEYPARDDTEKYLLTWAKCNKIRVLGICRGMQMMAVWDGASLIRIKNHVNVKHKLIPKGENEEFPLVVNSFHQYTIDSCPKNFKIIATSKNGSIEAIAHRYLPWEGWMWHPERETPFLEQDTRRVKALFVD